MAKYIYGTYNTWTSISSGTFSFENRFHDIIRYLQENMTTISTNSTLHSPRTSSYNTLLTQHRYLFAHLFKFICYFKNYVAIFFRVEFIIRTNTYKIYVPSRRKTPSWAISQNTFHYFTQCYMSCIEWTPMLFDSLYSVQKFFMLARAFLKSWC